ncbi:glycosyltransferase family 2 protein [Paracoccus ravus]|uniref:glycosyltransferase family 2 protein n=1 Tax=Paracoccus ravus TaxID=2447760 RepID=UPI0014303FD2|nr:glycosyltransferase [Paracoccus ravus]
MTSVRVSVVLPLYNDGHAIGAVLEALRLQRDAPDFEVIVVDDGSSDDGPDHVQPPFRLIRQENAGPAAARNRGAAEAMGEVILFLDSDCTPPPGWVARMALPILEGGFDAVMGTIRAANDGVVPRLVQLEIEDRYRGMSAAQNGVDFIAAPSCGFSRAVFLRIGGFDARLRQAEDVEIAYRLTAAGGRIAFVDEVPVAHLHQTGWREYLAVKYRRALGRLRVFDLHPEKRRHDSWTPLAFKLQFALVALSLPVALAALLFDARIFGLLALLLAAAVGLGWPLVAGAGDRLADLVGRPKAYLIAAAYVILRSVVILAAMVRLRLSRRSDGKDRAG